MARLTRRDFAAFLAAAPALAQTSSPAANQQFVPAPRTPDEANQHVSEATEKLKALSVPIDVEPAFAFKI